MSLQTDPPPSSSSPAAIYARVSTDEQARDGTSLQTQVERCRRLVEAKDDLFVLDEFIDEGISGSAASRPALDRLMRACRAGQVRAIVVLKLDRFSRSRVHLESALDELDRLGVGFVSVSESIDSTTAGGRMFRSVLGVFAAFEREMIVERSTAGLLAVARDDYWPGGPAPFGLEIEKRNGHSVLVVDDQEATTIRTATALLVDEGLTTWEAARRLNALGLLPRKAPRWEHMNLRRVLKLSHYSGRVMWGKGRTTSNLVEESIPIAVEPVLSPDRHQELQVVLASTSTGPRPVRKVYPLTGRLFGRCGAPFHGVSRSDRDCRQYRCKRRKSDQIDRCDDPRVDADLIESVVWTAVAGALAEPNTLRAMAAEYLGLVEGHQATQAEQLADIDREIERLEKAVTTSAADALRAGLSGDVVAEAVGQLEAELDVARQQRAQLLYLTDEHAGGDQLEAQLTALALFARGRLEHAGPELMKQVLTLLDIQVTVHHGETADEMRVQIEGHVGSDLLADVEGGDGYLSNAMSKPSTCCRQ